MGSQKYQVSEKSGFRNISYLESSIHWENQISSKVYYLFYLTMPRYVFDFRSLDQSRSKNPIKPGFVPFNRINFLAFLVFRKKWNDFGQKFQILENLNISGHRNCDAGVAIAMPASIFGHCDCDAGVAIATPENI